MTIRVQNFPELAPGLEKKSSFTDFYHIIWVKSRNYMIFLLSGRVLSFKKSYNFTRIANLYDISTQSPLQPSFYSIFLISIHLFFLYMVGVLIENKQIPFYAYIRGDWYQKCWNCDTGTIFQNCDCRELEGHDGGRNRIFFCSKDGSGKIILN